MNNLKPFEEWWISSKKIPTLEIQLFQSFRDEPFNYPAE